MKEESSCAYAAVGIAALLAISAGIFKPEKENIMEKSEQKDATPETHNQEQDNESEQAQTVTQDAFDRTTGALGEDESDSGKLPNPGAVNPEDMPDLIEKMEQMESSGRIDYGAYRGERNDDDETGSLGRRRNEDRDVRLSDEK